MYIVTFIGKEKLIEKLSTEHFKTNHLEDKLYYFDIFDNTICEMKLSSVMEISTINNITEFYDFDIEVSRDILKIWRHNKGILEDDEEEINTTVINERSWNEECTLLL